MTRFSVVIVNYNGGDFVQRALDSLKAQRNRSFEVLLVDNASTDGSVCDLDSDGIPSFTLIQSPTNLGFASANNLAANKATGEWLALLNPDAEATPDWLEKIDEAITRYPGIPMFASCQISLSNPDRLDGTGDSYFALGIPWRGNFGRSIDDMPSDGECFSPCGAGAIFHRDIFVEHGGFDDSFFCFCEDVDLAFRLRLQGHKCVFLRDAVIYHAGGALSGRVSEFALVHGSRNRLWTYLKNMPQPLLWLTLPGFVLSTVALLTRGVFTGRARPTFRGLMIGLRHRSDLLAERRRIQSQRTVSSLRIAKAMSWNPLLLLSRRSHVRLIRSRDNRPARGQRQKRHG